MGSVNTSVLSERLLAILDALPASVPEDVTSGFRQTVNSQANILDATQDENDGMAVHLACKTSKTLFGDLVITPDSPSYKSAQQSNWSMACWLPARCIIKLRNKVEVALALGIITHFKCPFAVRSGGHQGNPGFGSIGEEGVLLDLGSMNSVSLSDDQRIASLEPGATWKKVYEVLENENLNVPGGRISEVGVGGLILGGGMSHFSSHWGMVCDSVENFEVVLSNSEVVHANANDHPDLFRALKGGGPNFGIVTRFDLLTNEDPLLWYTIKMYSPTDLEAVMKASVAVEQEMERNSHIGFFLICKPEILLACMLYMNQAPPPTAFGVFESIKPVAVAVPEHMGSQLEFAKGYTMASGVNYLSGTVTVSPDPDTYAELFHVQQYIKFPPSCSCQFTFQPINAASVKISQSKGGNSLDIPAQKQSWLAVSASYPPTNATEEAAIKDSYYTLIDKLKDTAAQKGKWINYQFQNDSNYRQPPFRTLSEETLTFLKDVSVKYDPEQVFQKLQNGGFLLSRM